MKKDIESREDVEVLVNSFYSRVQQDDLIGPIFNDVAKVDWGHHLPKMYDFFETIILGHKGFKGNPMETHFKLNRQFPLKPEHFDQWKSLFFATIDELFEGLNASEAKQKATSIADLMFYKINNLSGNINVLKYPKQ